MPLLNLLKLNNSYHKLYRQLDILRIEDFLPENKSVQQKIQQQQTNNKQRQLWAPLKEHSHMHEFLLNIFDMRFGRLVKCRAIKLGSNEWRLFYPNVYMLNDYPTN